MTFQGFNSHTQSSRVMSNAEIRESVMAQIEADCLPEEWSGDVELVITAMTNVIAGDDRQRARIGGVWHTFEEIKRVYRTLTNENVYNVLEKAAKTDIFAGEPYFRAALYNEALEAPARTERLIRRAGY